MLHVENVHHGKLGLNRYKILKITTTKKLSKSILDQDVHQISGVVENKNFTKSGYDQFTPGDFPVILMKKWFKAHA